MHPSSSFSSSQSHQSIGAVNNLLCFGTAANSFLTSAGIDSPSLRIGSNSSATITSSHRFSSSVASEGAKMSFSSGNDSASTQFPAAQHSRRSSLVAGGGSRLAERSYCGATGNFSHGISADASGASSGSSAASCASSATMSRRSSSPAGLLNRLASDIGFAVTKGAEGYSTGNGSKLSRLSSQLCFNVADNTLSRISEVHESAIGGTSSQRGSQSSSAMAGFSLESWDNSHPTMSNVPVTMQGKHINGDIATFGSQYSSPHTAFELAGMEQLITHIPEDSVPCKVRAKRGCATHPRSIAERERRTRISVKLKKLQELVPNMDKQTSYADMLDSAVQHIKSLQTQIQQLNEELEQCKCGASKSPKDSFG